ncbi:hypothetical protein Tsubulata_038773 [Turnera subulata]|uniref:VQ domain-containing protein n=1 Tax=Turnera subulata TaxID=218843 RepID=A0A9Q0FHX3_9ROSI|nr:hypothetical protein Tsubulata_038773 [Turnera subulata]
MVSSNSTPSPFSIRKDSHTISKVKPKIRIIHIFAPEIIKTDVANFRELVQRLTGKPTAENRVCKKIKPRVPPCRKEDHNQDHQPPRPKNNNVVEQRRERVMIKEEEEMWKGANSGGFLSGFADLDGFIQELGGFPLLPLDANNPIPIPIPIPMHAAFEETPHHQLATK